MIEQAPVGQLVRQWRERRRRSQLDVSIAADLSSRHLSFIETGRSKPSREMLERICDELDVPLRDRNRIFLTAGYAPVHPERPLPELGDVKAAVDSVLSGHEPFPAMAINACWDLLSANRAAADLLSDLDGSLGRPPVNVIRATLHPDGLAPRLRNYGQWRRHVIRRVQRQLERTALPELVELLDDIRGYPVPAESTDVPVRENDLVVPMVLDTPAGQMRLLYSLTVFGAPRDVTLDEIAIETFFPADAATRALLGVDGAGSEPL